MCPVFGFGPLETVLAGALHTQVVSKKPKAEAALRRVTGGPTDGRLSCFQELSSVVSNECRGGSHQDDNERSFSDMILP